LPRRCCQGLVAPPPAEAWPNRCRLRTLAEMRGAQPAQRAVASSCALLVLWRDQECSVSFSRVWIKDNRCSNLSHSQMDLVRCSFFYFGSINATQLYGIS